MPNATELATTLVLAVKESLRDGHSVELDGLGTFHCRRGALEFVPECAPRVFIAYVEENVEHALRLADAFEAAGLRPWIDKRKLLPGQDWRRAIERAITRSDFFVPCFSRVAAVKRGQFPYEVRYALRCAERMPLDDLFVIPVRLEDCDVPQRIRATTQYVDLFPDRDRGIARVVASIREEFKARRRREAA